MIFHLSLYSIEIILLFANWKRKRCHAAYKNLISRNWRYRNVIQKSFVQKKVGNFCTVFFYTNTYIHIFARCKISLINLRVFTRQKRRRSENRCEKLSREKILFLKIRFTSKWCSFKPMDNE